MNKPSSLAEQVRKAQKVMSGWSQLQRNAVHLEGTDAFLIKHATSPSPRVHSTATANEKSKALA